MNKYGILITAYNEIGLVKRNIERIRNEYTKLNNSPIIIVTTSETDIGFKLLEQQYSNVHVVEFKDAPGSGDNLLTKSNPKLRLSDRNPLSRAPVFENPKNPPGGLFRFNYLAKRILLSIKKGLEKARNLGIIGLAHIHGDSWWDLSGEERLVGELDDLIKNKKLLIYDVAVELCGGEFVRDFMLACPEGMLINVKEAYKFGWGFRFDEIYSSLNENGIIRDKEDYFSPEYSSTETLLTTFAHWVLSGRNIFNKDTRISDIYYHKVKTRLYRRHHGKFENHFVNLEN